MTCGSQPAMQVSTGTAGVHGPGTSRMTRNGPPFYEVRSMALDVRCQTLVIVTEVEGIWSMQIAGDRPVFREIAPRSGTWGLFGQARRDPLGGVYLSNATMVVHYDPVEGIVPVLTSRELSPEGVPINDLAAAPDGRLFIATDNGMYIWRNGGVTDHLGRYEGMGVSPVLRTIAIDARNRVWFSSTGYVGFYADQAALAPTIGIEMVGSVPAETLLPEPTAPVPTTLPVLPATAADQAPFFAPDSVLAFLNPIIDPVLKAIRSIGQRG